MVLDLGDKISVTSDRLKDLDLVTRLAVPAAPVGLPPAILWMTCCRVRLLLLPGLLLLKIPRMLLAWEVLGLFGLLDMETNPESLLIMDFEFSTELDESDSFCGMTGLTPSKDLRTVEDCSGSLAFKLFSSLIFFGVDVVLFVDCESDILKNSSLKCIKPYIK